MPGISKSSPTPSLQDEGVLTGMGWGIWRVYTLNNDYIYFPNESAVKNPPANMGGAGDVGLIPGLGTYLVVEMASYSSVLAWTEEPGRLQSMGSQRVGHDLATKEQQNIQAHCFGFFCSSGSKRSQ